MCYNFSNPNRPVKGSAHEHEKTLAKHCVEKKPVATRVRKIKIQSCLPLAIGTRITTFSALRSYNQETKYTETWRTHIVCQVIRFIPPVFLNYLSITNNNNELSMSKAFTFK